MKFFFITIPKTATNSISKFVNFNNHYYHVPAKIVRKLKPEYDNIYTFTCVRNPIDLVISWYNYHKYSPRESQEVRDFYPTNINEWIINMNFKTHWNRREHLKLNRHWNIRDNPLEQYKYIYDREGNLLVKKVLKYENLSEDIEELRKELDIPKERQFPLENVSKHKVTKEDLTIDSIEKIKTFFKKDFELFDYEN